MEGKLPLPGFKRKALKSSHFQWTLVTFLVTMLVSNYYLDPSMYPTPVWFRLKKLTPKGNFQHLLKQMEDTQTPSVGAGVIRIWLETPEFQNGTLVSGHMDQNLRLALAL